MNDPANPPEYVAEVQRALSDLYKCEMRNLDFIRSCPGATSRDAQNPVFVACAMILGSLTDLVGVYDLAMSGRYRSLCMIARGDFETSLNASILLTDEGKSLERMVEHWEAFTVSGIKRELVLGDLLIRVEQVGASLENVPDDVLQRYEKFLGEDGKFRSRWTRKSVQGRVQAVHERYGAPVARLFGTIMMGVYRDASEILHGTLAGVKIAWRGRDYEDTANPKPWPSADQFVPVLQTMMEMYLARFAFSKCLSVECALNEFKQLSDEHADVLIHVRDLIAQLQKIAEESDSAKPSVGG